MAYIRHCISIGRSEHPEWPPQQVLDWHIKDGYWYSSSRHPGLLDGEVVPIRHVPGSTLVGLARITDTRPLYLQPSERPEPDLCFRYPVEFLNEEAVRGVRMQDFGITGTRLRSGLVGLGHGEALAIELTLREAIAGG